MIFRSDLAGCEAFLAMKEESAGLLKMPRLNGGKMNSRNNGLEPDGSLLFLNQIAEWLSTSQAAHFLSITENALRIMVYRGQIPVYRVGRRLRFKLHDLKNLFVKKGF